MAGNKLIFCVFRREMGTGLWIAPRSRNDGSGNDDSPVFVSSVISGLRMAPQPDQNTVNTPKTVVQSQFEESNEL